ncbi:hypothetical protein [Enterococcus sp. DIV0187]|uniref:hypothetical protein n=1 Tax=Enterococcus sp. DIV0187 TaxID=2774644 RepID=UPI003F225691
MTIRQFLQMNQKKIAIFAALALLFLFFSFPIIHNLSREANAVIGIFIASLLLWLSVGFDWPSLLCIGSIGLLPSIGINGALAASFGSNSFVFLFFTFLCTFALVQTSFISRVSQAFISSDFAKKKTFRLGVTVFLAVLFLGCFISPSVLFFSMYPIICSIIELLELEFTL